MIKREKYISEVRGFYDSDLIKIITGVRRCGKSVVLEQIMEEIGKTTDNLVFLDIEDRVTYTDKDEIVLDETDALESFISEVIPEAPGENDNSDFAIDVSEYI